MTSRLHPGASPPRRPPVSASDLASDVYVKNEAGRKCGQTDQIFFTTSTHRHRRIDLVNLSVRICLFYEDRHKAEEGEHGGSAPYHVRGQRATRLHRPQAVCWRRRRSLLPRPVLLGVSSSTASGSSTATSASVAAPARSQDAERLTTRLESKAALSSSTSASAAVEADLHAGQAQLASAKALLVTAQPQATELDAQRVHSMRARGTERTGAVCLRKRYLSIEAAVRMEALGGHVASRRLLREMEAWAGERGAGVCSSRGLSTRFHVRALFSMRQVFTPSATQADLFAEIAQLAQSCIDGYNMFIFARGQTGSGKSWTMEDGGGCRGDAGDDSACEELKDKGWTCMTEGQFLEIVGPSLPSLYSPPPAPSRTRSPQYETITDAPGPNESQHKHEIHHHPAKHRTTVSDAREASALIGSAQVFSLLVQAQDRRRA
ncbi:P-loop containing nucleoside triphosphate hydrolase protein [Mycena latifolia]|nr:P-loop containing nucleoside triphosphate hydrolase protein [Mycena latifolia]